MGGDAVELGKPVGVDGAAEGFAFGVTSHLLGRDLLLAAADALAGFVEGVGHQFDVRAGGGESGFVVVSTFQALQFFVFEAFDFAVGEFNLVLHGFSLCGSGHGVKLSAVTGGFIAMDFDIALQAGSQGIFASEGVRESGGLMLRFFEGGLRLSRLGGKSAKSLGEAGSLKFDGLELDQIVYQGLHSWIEV